MRRGRSATDGGGIEPRMEAVFEPRMEAVFGTTNEHEWARMRSAAGHE